MRKIIFSLAVMSLFFTMGCSGQWISIKPSEASYSSSLPSTNEYEKNYTKGKEKTAYIGQEIIAVKGYSRVLGEFPVSFKPKENFSVEAQYKIFTYKIKGEANKKYVVNESITTGEPYYLIKLSDNDSMQWGILVSGDGRIFNRAIYSYYHRMLFYPSSIIVNPDNIIFSVEKGIKPIRVIPGMSYELIYSGKNDVSLNITYKEFSPDNLARAAFFQNLTYQANAKQIRFRDFLIQIQNVTNEKITYTVIEDGLN